MSAAATTTAPGGPPGRTPRSARRGRTPLGPTVVLVLGAVYCLLPVLWVVTAATKTPGELFTTFSLAPSFNGGLTGNVTDLLDYGDGVFWRWALNTVLYAGVGSVLTVAVSAAAGYALAKYRFRGREAVFRLILAGVLVPQVTLAIPQYLLLAQVGLTNTYWSVLLPSLISPFSIYLCRIYAMAAVPDQLLEAGRIDGAGEWRLFGSVAMPLMLPGLITVLLLQFVAIWNNFLLPFIMLSSDERYPLTVGLFSLLNQGASQPALYTLVISGAMLSVLPLVALFLLLQRYWKLDMLSGGLKG
ncbi:carbohydrate ABC transporter permease [uncultured Pseudokineococcus sp.]|uniref:carbohydrate ABC transporter permease n=1 Tax=uncultured Pseudokineococcus sp. TaxID=1642928 RepID=UPI002639FAAD|nr:carbohydrate ABC transporter permease [uncultured Pseudokineococcus sp.]